MFSINSISELILKQTGIIDNSLGITYNLSIKVLLKSNQPFFRRKSSSECDCYYRLPTYILNDNGSKKNVYYDKFDGKTQITFSDLLISTNEELIILSIDIEKHINHMSSHWTNIYENSTSYFFTKAKLVQTKIKPSRFIQMNILPKKLIISFLIELDSIDVDITAQVKSEYNSVKVSHEIQNFNKIIYDLKYYGRTEGTLSCIGDRLIDGYTSECNDPDCDCEDNINYDEDYISKHSFNGKAFYKINGKPSMFIRNGILHFTNVTNINAIQEGYAYYKECCI